MHFIKSWKNNKFFFRFTLSYIIILIITLVIGNFQYYQAVKIIETDSKERNISLLEQCMEIIDRRLSQINKLTTQISLNNKISNSIKNSTPDIGINNLDLKNIIEDILQYSISNDFIMNFFVYLFNRDYIITPETLYDSSLFYKCALNYKNISYDTWKRDILARKSDGDYIPATLANISGVQHTIVTYIHSLPLEYNKEPLANLVVLIDQNEFNKLLANTMVTDKGFAYIADADGTIITCLSGKGQSIEPVSLDRKAGKGFVQRKISGEEMIITYTTSNSNHWVYVAAIPKYAVLAKAEYIKRTTLGIILISLFIGILIALILSYNLSKPVKNLIEDNVLLQEKMNNQIPIIQQAFYERLFKGKFSDLNEAKVILSYLNTEITAKRYMVIIMHMYDKDVVINREVVHELGMAKVFLKDIIIKYLGNKGLTYDIDERKTALLLYFNTEEDDVCLRNTEMIAKGIHDELLGIYNIHVSFTGGNLCRNLLEVYKSFDEAIEALNYEIFEREDCIFWYKNSIKSIKVYYYPVEMETRLQNCIKAGEEEELDKILAILYNENVINGKLPAQMLSYLVFQLRGTLMRLTSNTGVDIDLKSIIESMNFTITPEEDFQKIITVFHSVCYQFKKNKKSRNTTLKDQIIEYIKNSYMDPNISLYNVASKFGLTESYMSHFFKEQTGENFVSYLENIRIEHACEFLSKAGYSIDEIAGQVGYNSAQAFRRAFKRAKGLSPNNFRV